MKRPVFLIHVLLVMLVSTSCNKENAGHDKQLPSNKDAPPVAPQYVDKELEAAIASMCRSTNRRYILVTIVDRNTGKSSKVGVSIEMLDFAVGKERRLSRTNILDFIRNARGRQFEFSDAALLEQLLPKYSQTDLSEIGRLLVDLSAEDVCKQQNDLDSPLNRLSVKKYGSPYGYQQVVLRILLERGVACSAGCKPGLVHTAE